ncbi:MAG: HD domain-containing protein [Deltaproteobacteria bacterium]|jgi:putative hydrolase of HD superfamily|nr:HD domain-containing protein [Deltaproteobacteria bacterium]
MSQSPKILEFLFETASLRRTPRTGYQFLGQGQESVAEHSFGVTVIAFVLARLAKGANLEKILKMALFHDLAEARTGDLNYVNKRYVKALETEAMTDAVKGLPFEAELMELFNEWRAGETLEAQLAADADQLDMMLELRRLASQGLTQATEWFGYAVLRLKTDLAKTLAKELSQTDPDGWWFKRRAELWINPALKGEES